MPRPLLAAWIVLAFLIVPLAAFWGVEEALSVGLGLGLICLPAFLNAKTARILGTLWLFALIFVFCRTAMSGKQAILVGLVVAAVGALFFGARIHRRLCYLGPSLVLLIYVTCSLMYAAPGSPLGRERVASQQVIEAQMERLGVAATPTAFFVNYMSEFVASGSLGESAKWKGRSVNELLLPAFPVSLTLGLLALILAVVVGLTLGIRAGLKPHSVSDYASMSLAMVGISLPNFVLGAGLLAAFALRRHWLPVAGWGSYEHLILPALTLALPTAAYIARLARSGTIEVMQNDYIRTARAKGLPERVVVLKHALRGALMPVVSFLGPAAAAIFTGSFVVETLFGVPGMGLFFVYGATGRDYAVVLGTAIIYFCLVAIFNLLVDLILSWMDPRIREDL